jgi:hypothetical protein
MDKVVYLDFNYLGVNALKYSPLSFDMVFHKSIYYFTNKLIKTLSKYRRLEYR